jgi:exonuclease III
MKIVSWNCAGALRKKTKFIDQFNADILVIQECEDPERSTKEYTEWAGNYLWYGETKNKGIGIFAKKENHVENLNWSKEYTQEGFNKSNPALTWRSEDLKVFLPCMVNDEITLLGVWTKKNKSEYFGYIGQFWKYLQIHRKDLSKGKTIVCGDFNSNVFWDKKDSWWNHSDVVQELNDIGLQSLYHLTTGENQGKETKPTFFLHKNELKPYHIDYAFVSSDLIADCHIEMGKREDWIDVSDHVPLTFHLGL